MDMIKKLTFLLLVLQYSCALPPATSHQSLVSGEGFGYSYDIVHGPPGIGHATGHSYPHGYGGFGTYAPSYGHGSYGLGHYPSLASHPIVAAHPQLAADPIFSSHPIAAPHPVLAQHIEPHPFVAVTPQPIVAVTPAPIVAVSPTPIVHHDPVLVSHPGPHHEHVLLPNPVPQPLPAIHHEEHPPTLVASKPVPAEFLNFDNNFGSLFDDYAKFYSSPHSYGSPYSFGKAYAYEGPHQVSSPLSYAIPSSYEHLPPQFAFSYHH